MDDANAEYLESRLTQKIQGKQIVVSENTKKTLYYFLRLLPLRASKNRYAGNGMYAHIR